MIGMALSAYLTLEERRDLCKKSQSFDYRMQTPATPVQGLFVNSQAQDLLARETGDVFGNAVWLDQSVKDVLQLKLSPTKDLPSHGEMTDPFLAETFDSIEKEGDGLRSYVGICLSLLLAIRPVTLIDEPELCLHPPQAVHMGRFIGQHSKENHVTFVATHSSHVLRGILETGRKVTVIRLSRSRKEFNATLVTEAELVNKLRNPRTRAESILDGMFSKAVVLVESEGDREEYQAAAEAIEDYPATEISFVPVGGTGGFAEPLRFYQMLRIPVAIVSDLDLICDADKMRCLVAYLCQDDVRLREIEQTHREIMNNIKALPPTITEQEAKSTLSSLAQQEWDWHHDGDNILRRELNQLEGRLKRVRRLKEGGIEAYREYPHIYEQLQRLVSEAASIGLFLVPVGELEAWVTHLTAAVPKNNVSKSDRAALVADLIREARDKSGDIWSFIASVVNHIRRSIAVGS
jgi:hypothetical protein